MKGYTTVGGDVLFLSFSFRGGRIFKTAIAVFITAWLCALLDWPATFAVITAIVTLEPTVTDSVKKSFVRFPASAIGAFYTVLSVFLLGHTPLTYTVSAALTIATCYKLKLHDGLLVATLTAVAMVDVVHSNFLIAFIVRLGTTTIGLLVSTAVNMLVFPPEYSTMIAKHLATSKQKLQELTPNVIQALIAGETDRSIHPAQMNALQKDMALTAKLLQLQEKDTFHPLAAKSKYPIAPQKSQFQALKLMTHHLENLLALPLTKPSWTTIEHLQLVEANKALATQWDTLDAQHYKEQLATITAQFFAEQRQATDTTFIPIESLLLFEIIALYEQLPKVKSQ